MGEPLDDVVGAKVGVLDVIGDGIADTAVTVDLVGKLICAKVSPLGFALGYIEVLITGVCVFVFEIVDPLDNEVGL